MAIERLEERGEFTQPGYFSRFRVPGFGDIECCTAEPDARLDREGWKMIGRCDTLSVWWRRPTEPQVTATQPEGTP